MSITKNFSKDYPDLLFHYNTEKNEYSISKKNNDENESIETFLTQNNIRYTDLEEIFYNYHDKLEYDSKLYYNTYINKIIIKENDLSENIKSKLSVKDFIQKNKEDDKIEMKQNKKDEYTIFYKQKTNISIFNHDYNSLDYLLEKIQKNFKITIIDKETNNYICSSHIEKKLNTSITFKRNELDTIVNNLNNNSINYNNKIQMKKEKQIDDFFMYTILFIRDSDKIYFFYQDKDYVLFHKNNDIYIINMKGESSKKFSINDYNTSVNTFKSDLDNFSEENINNISISNYIDIYDEKIEKPSENWDYVYDTEDDFIRLSFNNVIDLGSIVNKNRSLVMEPRGGFVRKLKNNNSINSSKQELIENFEDLHNLDF